MTSKGPPGNFLERRGATIGNGRTSKMEWNRGSRTSKGWQPGTQERSAVEVANESETERRIG